MPITGKIKVTTIMIRHAFGMNSGMGSSRPNPGPVRIDIAVSINRRCQPV